MLTAIFSTFPIPQGVLRHEQTHSPCSISNTTAQWRLEQIDRFLDVTGNVYQRLGTADHSI